MAATTLTTRVRLAVATALNNVSLGLVRAHCLQLPVSERWLGLLRALNSVISWLLQNPSDDHSAYRFCTVVPQCTRQGR